MIGIGDAIGEVVVVGKDEQPARVLIEPADRRYPLADVGDQIVYGGPAFRVFIGRDVAFGFIEEDDRSSPVRQQVCRRDRRGPSSGSTQ